MLIRLGLAFAIVAIGSQSPGIVGTWRGTSLCSDKVASPSCNDEQAIYDIRPKGSSRDTVTVHARKLANGVREEVSTDDFVRRPDGSWQTDLATARYHLRIV